MSNRILVLGSTGKIGTLLVTNLQQKKADFIGSASSPRGVLKLKRIGLEGITLDYGNPSSLDKAMQGIDSLFMLTPASEQMVTWGKNIIQAAKKNGIKFILRSSIMDPYANAPHLLFRLHGQVDQMLRDSGITHVIVQPFSFMQNFRYYWGSTISQNDSFYSMHGDYRVSYIDLRDVALIEATILANPALHNNMEYTVSGPDSLSNQDTARILSIVLGRIIHYVPVEEGRFMDELRKTGMSDWDISLYVDLERHILEDHQSVISDLTFSVTGKTSTSFEQFAQDFALAWTKSPASVAGK